LLAQTEHLRVHYLKMNETKWLERILKQQMDLLKV
jgi:hypothetical protein